MIRVAAPLLLGVLCASAAAQGYVDEIAAGRQEYEANRFDEALTHFARARSLAPDDWRGHAWQAFTLIEQARHTKDRSRRLALLGEAETVIGVLVKRRIVLLQDPLYKYVLSIVHELRKEYARSFEYVEQAYRTPRDRFAPYAEIQLRANVERAYAGASLQLAAGLVMRGGDRPVERADRLLEEAAGLLSPTDPNRLFLERLSAVVAEKRGRYDEAIRHLRRCIELAKDHPEVVQEATAAIATIHFRKRDFEKGAEVLKELPPDCVHPDVVAARAFAYYQRAMAAPESEAMDAAIAHHRDAIAKLAAGDRNRLVVPFVELVLKKVGPDDARKHRALLEEAERMAQREIDRRPECPSLYAHLSRIYKLMGKENLAIHYQELHKRKEAEYRDLDHYDELGRPRCR